MTDEFEAMMQAQNESSRRREELSDESVCFATSFKQRQHSTRDFKGSDGTIVEMRNHQCIILRGCTNHCIDCNEVTEDHSVFLNR